MDEWVGRRKNIGLYVAAVDAHICYLDVDPSQSRWLIKNVDQLHPFECALLVFMKEKEEEQSLGYLWWHEFVQSSPSSLLCEVYVTRESLHTTYHGILVFPWEMKDDEALNVSPSHKHSVYALAWKHINDDPGALDVLESRDTLDADRKEGALRIVVAVLDILFSVTKQKRQYPSMQRVTHADKVYWRAVEHLIETDVVTWLQQEGLAKRYPIHDVTAQDIQYYMFAHSVTLADGPWSLPKWIFCVPYEEWGVGPAHEGYTSRLTWKDMKHVLRKQETRFLTYDVGRAVVKELNGDIDIGNYRNGQFKFLMKKREKEDMKVFTLPTTTTTASTRVVNKTYTVIPDIEDLVTRASPPCLQELMESGVWYKDQQRVHLASQLQTGGIALETADRVFEEAMTFNTNNKNTWDHKQTWERKYNGCACDKFIENTRTNAPYTIHCPMARMNTNDASTLVERSRRSCAARFKEKHPTKARDRDVLHRPYQWYLWYYGRK